MQDYLKPPVRLIVDLNGNSPKVAGCTKQEIEARPLLRFEIQNLKIRLDQVLVSAIKGLSASELELHLVRFDRSYFFQRDRVVAGVVDVALPW